MALESIFTSRQVETLEAATECILPSEESPGAAEARVMVYVRWLAAQPIFERRGDRWRRGLDLLQSLAQSLYGKGFESCTLAERDEVLQKLGKIPHPATQRFLDGLLSLTLGGYLCDPKYGGNHERAGWKAVGYERRTAAPQAATPEPVGARGD